MTKEEEIRKLAYKIYLKKGCREGEALDDWIKSERVILWKERFFKFIRHPLFLIIISGIIIWSFQQKYLKNEELLRRKFEITNKISPICASYYQETWNQWYAFKDKMPSEEYRKNIQRIIIEAKIIETQLPILFRDNKIYEDWKSFLHIYWEANYLISRQGISEEELNKKLNSSAPLIDDMLNRMYNELK